MQDPLPRQHGHLQDALHISRIESKQLAGECFRDLVGRRADDPNGDDPPVRRAFLVRRKRGRSDSVQNRGGT
jgi:hypothetical protein